MSEILSEVTEKVVKIARRVTGIECDICGKIIPVHKRNESMYFKITTGHNDWGNDSFESRKTQDICPDCIDKFTTEYLQDADGTTKYIEIETEYARAYERWEREE